MASKQQQPQWQQQNRRASKKGPALPPRPNPGHRLYNNYTVRCYFIDLMVSTEQINATLPYSFGLHSLRSPTVLLSITTMAVTLGSSLFR